MTTHSRFAAAAAIAVSLAFAAETHAQCTEVTSGLLRPQSIVQTQKDNLIASEAGASSANTGRLSIVSPGGVRRTLIDGMPSALSYETNAASGIAGLFLRGRTLYVAIGVGDAVLAGPIMGTTRLNPNPSSPLFSSVLAVHFSAAVEQTTMGFTLAPADHQTLANGQPVTLTNGAGQTIRVEMVANFPNFTPEPRPDFAEHVRHSNPFGIVGVGNALYLTDGAQNSVVRIDISARTFSTLTAFERIANPQFNPNPPPPSVGGPFLDAVPTAITYSDGQLLVTVFRGFPFPNGSSAVVRVDPLTGSQSAFITGLKTAIGILPIRADDDPSTTKHLVLQHASGPMLAPPGLLLRFDTPAGPPTTLASCMATPTAMTLDAKSGTLYVTELAGRIVAIPVAAEAHVTDGGLAPTVRNISARGRVEMGDNVLIGGFIVGQGTGGGAVKVLLRAIGPSLAMEGVGDALADPVLTVYDVNGAQIARNDSWRGDQGERSQQNEIIATRLPPQSDAEAAILVNLPPGNYTAIVRSKGTAEGIALVEVFHVQ
ncbi:MAG TPA: ScyD/ScyE family protein [Chthoniobacterales bacterium]